MRQPRADRLLDEHAPRRRALGATAPLRISVSRVPCGFRCESASVTRGADLDDDLCGSGRRRRRRPRGVRRGRDRCVVVAVGVGGASASTDAASVSLPMRPTATAGRPPAAWRSRRRRRSCRTARAATADEGDRRRGVGDAPQDARCAPPPMQVGAAGAVRAGAGVLVGTAVAGPTSLQTPMAVMSDAGMPRLRVAVATNRSPARLTSRVDARLAQSEAGETLAAPASRPTTGRAGRRGRRSRGRRGRRRRSRPPASLIGPASW